MNLSKRFYWEHFICCVLAAPCSPYSLAKPVNGSKNCTSTENGYLCTLQCDQSYVFYDDPGTYTKTINCSFGGSWPEHISACITGKIIRMFYAILFCRKCITIGTRMIVDFFYLTIVAVLKYRSIKKYSPCKGETISSKQEWLFIVYYIPTSIWSDGPDHHTVLFWIHITPLWKCWRTTRGFFFSIHKT